MNVRYISILILQQMLHVRCTCVRKSEGEREPLWQFDLTSLLTPEILVLSETTKLTILEHLTGQDRQRQGSEGGVCVV